jgi:hypothetical protein
MTMECSLLYVSRATLAAERLDAAADDIVALSRAYNASAGITGGLVLAGGYFAQLLEGPTEAVKTLMERINRDPRHEEVSVLRIAARSKRQFPDWSMAYAGGSTYVAQQIAALLGPGPADPKQIDRLTTLIVSFASM